MLFIRENAILPAQFIEGIYPFGAADASAVMPYDFLRLPFAVGCAWLLFQELTGIWTWVGASVIFSATYFITWHETRAKRRKQAVV